MACYNCVSRFLVALDGELCTSQHSPETNIDVLQSAKETGLGQILVIEATTWLWSQFQSRDLFAVWLERTELGYGKG